MQPLFEWFFNNKEWVFSGIGIAVIGLIAKLFFRSKKDGSKSNKQKSCMFTFGSNNKSKIKQDNEQQ